MNSRESIRAELIAFYGYTPKFFLNDLPSEAAQDLWSQLRKRMEESPLPLSFQRRMAEFLNAFSPLPLDLWPPPGDDPRGKDWPPWDKKKESLIFESCKRIFLIQNLAVSHKNLRDAAGSKLYSQLCLFLSTLSYLQIWQTDLDEKASQPGDERLSPEELLQAKKLAESANSAKTAFLANMSHEIRTPLTAIIGYVELLRDPTLSEKDRNAWIDIATRNGQALTKLIDDILDLSKIEAGRFETDIIAFSLPDLIEEVRLLFAETASSKGISLTTCLASEVPSIILSDPLRLRQILSNIVGNAVKFTTAGYVAVKVSAKSEDQENFELVFAVEDSGPGLSAEQKRMLFQPFVQADPSIRRKYGGTGLGLALSRHLAKALGGTISIHDSNAKEGACFIVTIKARKSHEKYVEQQEPVQLPNEHVLDGLKILLVEDAPDNRLLISSILDRFGATVTTASDGVEGVQKALHDAFDVVLMDLQMPRMDGYEAIRSLNQNNYQVPVIAMTAHAMQEDREETRAAGFSGHISKPIQITEMLNAILHSTGKIQSGKEIEREREKSTAAKAK